MKVFGQYCFRILFCCGYFFFKERFNYIFEKREREILIVSPLLHYPIYCSRLGRSQELSWSPNWVAGNQILSRVICGELDQREGSQNFNLCFCLGCQHVKQLMNLMCHNANACRSISTVSCLYSCCPMALQYQLLLNFCRLLMVTVGTSPDTSYQVCLDGL